MSKEINELKRIRLRQELGINLIKVINNFKSKEEPKLTLTNDDVINTLSSLITRRTLN